MKVGNLTVVEDSGQRVNSGLVLWRCRCDCGNEILVSSRRLARGAVTSCGCSSAAPRREDSLTGEVFGNLTVVEDSGQRENGLILWRCRCRCGNEILVPRGRLVRGTVTSCGCVPSAPRYRGSLVGKVFGNLTVVEDSGQRDGNYVIWRCRCRCGNEVLATRNCLTSGAVTDCGCTTGFRYAPKDKDLTGQVFGNLTVLGDSGQRERSNILWRCRCVCGNEIIVPRRRLFRGTVTSCGCVPAAPKFRDDLRGQVFGKLTVLEDSGQRNHTRIIWRCRCACGNEILVSGERLTRGHATSCGCVLKANDLRGQVFGSLTVLDDSGQRRKGNGSILWRCRCVCGNEILATRQRLTRGTVADCGCLSRKRGARPDSTSGLQDGCPETDVPPLSSAGSPGTSDRFEEAVEARETAETVGF